MLLKIWVVVGEEEGIKGVFFVNIFVFYDKRYYSMFIY